MKPLPNLDDQAAMLLRGKRSALAAARNEATIELRDAYTLMESCEWSELGARLDRLRAAVERLDTVTILWASIK
jgi:hypothetical protein